MQVLLQNAISVISTIMAPAKTYNAPAVIKEVSPPGIAEHNLNKTTNPPTSGPIKHVTVVGRLAITNGTTPRSTIRVQVDQAES